MKNVINGAEDMEHLGTKQLETDRLILRKFTLDDAEAMFRNWVNDPDVTRYLTWQPHGSIELTRKINVSDVSKYDSLSHYQWAVVLKTLNEPIGGINVVKIDEACNSVEVAYRIGKAWWHQGYASEALSSVIKFLFEQVGANRIAAMHDTRNPNSGAVMRKCGMSYEGTFRQFACNNQGLYDAACYAILAEDYKRVG
jgi:ribosomal-protein-alanine N-acetyltransferase